MINPLVSIIIPTYNRADLISETLDSILAQTYPNWECIVVDDGSTDNTAEVVGNYLVKDPRFQYHHRPADRPQGANACRNYGFELSKGVYIQWLDSDDLISDKKIQEQTNALLFSKNAIAICKWKRFYQNPNDEKLRREYSFFKNYENPLNIFEDFGNSNSFLPIHSYLVSRLLVCKSGLWNENLQINQDGEFFTRIILSCSGVIFVKDAFAFYRTQKTVSSSTFSNETKAFQAVQSWKMIDNHLNQRGIYNSKYVNTAKDYLYLKLSHNYKEVITKNKIFFKKQLKNNSLVSRLKRKLF